MKRRSPVSVHKSACGILLALSCTAAFADPVTLTEDAQGFTLSNGTITARIAKRNGDLSSMKYKGTEVLTNQSGRAGGYWSHDASPAPGGPPNVSAVTIDPKTTNGDRGEVSVKAISGGKKLGHPAGGAADGDFPADIEIRYSLGKDDSGIYTYCIFTHLPEYPAGSIGEARYCAKLAATFDWLSVDAQRNKYYPEEPKGEDKYVYTAVQSKNLAYGWSSTKDHLGMWIVNPTIEYLSGGPTKPEFMCHRDTTAVAAPCLLNYWRSSHYGGAAVGVAEGEKWTKVIGPFMLYVNSGGDHDVLWKDALAKADTEKKAWPYDWVSGVDYSHKDQRSTVTGSFKIQDPLAPLNLHSTIPTLHYTVGLAAPTYPIAGGPNGGQRMITWQTDAKHYEFCNTVDGNPDGAAFTIPNVRPGTYTLYAFADGILGEYSKADVTIPEGGKPVDLGTLEWKPVRHGKQLWDIGLANRTATEFAGADHYFAMDIGLQYPKLFPDDVSYTIGKSVAAEDWFFQHIPHNVDPNAQIVPFSGIRGQPGKPTPYAIHFDMPAAPTGRATLRLAICGTGARSIDV